MHVNLAPEVQRLIDELINLGQIQSAEQVVSAAISRMHDDLSPRPWTDERLRAEIARGIEQADRGEFAQFTAKEISARGRTLLGLEPDTQ